MERKIRRNPRWACECIKGDKNMRSMLITAIIVWFFCLYKSAVWDDFEGVLLTLGTTFASGIITYYILYF